MSKRNMDGLWKVRAIQLDLARHIEPVDYVFDYIDSSAKNGFNTMVLYLEGRIRTKNFPFRSPRESYSPEEMGRIVRHASKRGMDLIPVVPALGHAEHFLTCKELTHLSEERDGKGRFGAASPFVFCVSKNETYDFLEGYLTEIAEIFHGKNFHLGLDEAWNFGFCPLCQKKWKKDGLGKMFVGHLERLEAILGKLGKRMWMWDDMFEIFPEQLENAPKSIVMCHWNYDGNIEPEGSQAHFVNRFRQDWLKEYERLGIDAVICPWDRYADNIESFTKYAKSRKVLGALLTQWEGSPRFHPEQPLISKFTGKLWKGASSVKSWDSAISEFHKSNDLLLKNSLKDLVSLPRHHLRSGLRNYLSGSMQREERLEQELRKLALDALTEKLKGVSGGKRSKFDMILWSSKMDLIFWALREIVPSICNPSRSPAESSELAVELQGISAAFKRLMNTFDASLKKWRLDLSPDDKKIRKHYQDVSKLIADLSVLLKKNPRKSGWLAVTRLYLQDFYGSPRLKITVISKNAEVIVAEGCIKPDTIVRGRTGGHYEFYFPFECSETPERIRIEGWGYGGQGLSSIELKNKDTVLKPSSVKSSKGPVSNADAILVDDSSFAILGRTDIRSQMLNPKLADEKGIVELVLKLIPSCIQKASKDCWIFRCRDGVGNSAATVR